MNKVMLEVIKINEDVIATSSVDCASYKHAHLTNVGDNEANSDFYFEVYLNKVKIDNSISNGDNFEDYENAQSGDWYYLDIESGHYFKCSGDHSDYSGNSN